MGFMGVIKGRGAQSGPTERTRGFSGPCKPHTLVPVEFQGGRAQTQVCKVQIHTDAPKCTLSILGRECIPLFWDKFLEMQLPYQRACIFKLS